MAFLENTYFPDRLALWMVGGHEYNTGIAKLPNAREHRDAKRLYGVAQFKIADDRIKLSDAPALIDLFDAAMGRFNGFRVKYRFNQTATGAEGTLIQLSATTWQMTKTNSLGKVKPIIKPRAGIVVAGGGVYSVNTTNGIITKSSGADPTGWTGSFDYPCRFDTDLPEFGVTPDGAFFSCGGIGLVELTEP